MTDGRDLHANMAAGVQQSRIQMVLMGRFAVVSDPLVAWTGPGTFAPTTTGDNAMDGQTFAPFAPFLSMTDIKEDMGTGGPVTFTVTGHDVDEDLLRQVVRDKRRWLGKKAYLWVGLLDTDEHTVIQNPARIKTGVMTKMTTNRGKDNATVSVEIDVDLGKARGAPFRWVDHARIWPSDTFSSFIVLLANKPSGFISQSYSSVYVRGGTNREGGEGGRIFRIK